jgi:4-carboxymuconolactone decarboxylase
MKHTLIVAALLLLAGSALAQVAPTTPGESSATADVKEEILNLSKDKWTWMADRNMDALEALFHEVAVFVHMGGTMSRAHELEIIESGSIQYKKADIEEASVRVIGTTAIVLNRIRLLAVVGGNEVTNPFVVTEVYVQQDGKWLLAALSFTRTIGQ